VLGDEYKIVKSETLSAMNLIIFAHESIFHHIDKINSSYVKTGFANITGNKGAVGISFKYKKLSFLFIGCHLAAGQNAIDKRNKDLARINTNMQLGFSNQNVDHVHDLFDFSFYLGDFNCRVDLEKENAMKILSQGEFDKVLEYDQLKREFETKNPLYDNLLEGNITFSPTYKYLPGTEQYDSSERVPSWTDRILYRAKKNFLTQCKYSSINDTYLSDHKAVYSIFKLQCDDKKIDDSDLPKSGVCFIY
jgi:hypothetical protein